jgi:tetratricopeptide (TPR) repeat protein
MIGSKERRGQLSTLIKALAADVPPDDAHQQALGDLKKLETELRRYVSGFSFPGFKRELQLDAQTIRTYRLSSGEAAAARGDFLLHLGRTREARALLEQAVAEAPGLSAAHESLGLVELRDGRHAEAEARLARALELAPDNYQARYHRDFVAAKAARTAEDTARREAELRRVISLNPQFSPAHVRLTRLLMEEKRWGEALPVARRACELDPAILWYQLLVKQALTHLGLAGEAAKVEGAILSAARSDPEVLASVVSHYQEDGRGQEAEALLRRARDANPRAISILSQLARFLGREKRAQEAEAVWREALKVQPDVPLLQNALAYALAEEGTKAAEALELVDKALKRQPKVGAYLDTRGWALFKLKRFAEAEEALRQALQADPGEAALHDHLGDVLLARGNRAAALEQWQRALAASDLDDELKAALETKVREAAALKPS